MSVLARSSVGYLRRHPWQFALAVLGICTGVAVIVAVDLANESARTAFRLSMASLNGQAVSAYSAPVFDSLAGFPAAGICGRLAVDKSSGRLYIDDGTTWKFHAEHADTADLAAMVMPAVVNINTDKVVERQNHPFMDDPFFRRFFDMPDQPQRRQRLVEAFSVIHEDLRRDANRKVAGAVFELLGRDEHLV